MSDSINCKQCETSEFRAFMVDGLCTICAGKYIKQLQAQLDQHRWIPVGEPPKETADYIILIPAWGRTYVASVQSYHKEDGWQWCHATEISHYTPIPTLPEQEPK